MTRLLPIFLASLTLVGACACSDECDEGTREQRQECRRNKDNPTPAPTPLPPPVPTLNVFEFRVLGDADGVVEIRYGTTQEGTTILSSQTPWFVTVRTIQTSSFLTLTARRVLDPFDPAPRAVFLQVQIVVNGVVFREASAIGLEPVAAISGLYQAQE
jgi:hypothetical protein